jgi:hypothetical protein
MHPEQDFDLEAALPTQRETLEQDLELHTLIARMAARDRFLFAIVERALLLSLSDPDGVAYRQDVLRDCLAHPALARGLYDLTGEALAEQRSVWGISHFDSPRVILNRSVRAMRVFIDYLRRLREFAREHVDEVRSEGLSKLFAMLERELDDSYLARVEEEVEELTLPRGMLVSVRLGRAGRGTDYVLRKPAALRWLDRLRLLGRADDFSFELDPHDQGGARALGELTSRGVNVVANALTQSTDHISGFFAMLRSEIAFYVGCVNLHEHLQEKGEPVCFPTCTAGGDTILAAEGLYDVCLSLTVEGRVVGNDLTADGKRLVMITGANQGGKSTFLRSVGLAQLMMQAGMFVAGTSFRANLCEQLFTHFKREEDASMQSGKLDEELGRMSEIAHAITPRSLLLCNESFASTNEREGSEIARQIVRALSDAGVKVLYVTHLFDLAHSLYVQQLPDALFLRAERLPDGARTFRMVEGEPLPTSYGHDTYRRVFGPDHTSTPDGHIRSGALTSAAGDG